MFERKYLSEALVASLWSLGLKPTLQTEFPRDKENRRDNSLWETRQRPSQSFVSQAVAVMSFPISNVTSFLTAAHRLKLRSRGKSTWFGNGEDKGVSRINIIHIPFLFVSFFSSVYVLLSWFSFLFGHLSLSFKYNIILYWRLVETKDRRREGDRRGHSCHSHQADTNNLTSSSKFSGSCVLT